MPVGCTKTRKSITSNDTKRRLLPFYHWQQLLVGLQTATEGLIFYTFRIELVKVLLLVLDLDEIKPKNTKTNT